MKIISLIIPSYNESENIVELCNRLIKINKKYKYIEIIIVNNGSTDSTAYILKKHPIYKTKNFKLVKIRKNIGYGNGIIKGIYQAKGEIIAWFHADLQTNPNDVVSCILKYKKKLLKNKTIIKGKRKSRSSFDNLFTYFMSKIVNIVFNVKLEDVNAQPKIFNKKFILQLKNPPKDFSLDLYFLLTAIKCNYKIDQFPIRWGNRFAGVAKGGGNLIGKFKLTYRTFKYIINLKRKLKWK